MYLEPIRTYKMEFVPKIVNSLKLFTILTKKAPSQMLDWVLNISLSLCAVIGNDFMAP